MTRASKAPVRPKGRHLQSARQRALVAVVVSARNATGLSQREFSMKLGKAPNFMQRIESGAVPLTVLDFLAIANAAGIAADELMRRVMR